MTNEKVEQSTTPALDRALRILESMLRDQLWFPNVDVANTALNEGRAELSRAKARLESATALLREALEEHSYAFPAHFDEEVRRWLSESEGGE